MKTILTNLHNKVDSLVEDVEIVNENINETDTILSEIIEDETLEFINRN